jgi:hypothetical protein
MSLKEIYESVVKKKEDTELQKLEIGTKSGDIAKSIVEELNPFAQYNTKVSCSYSGCVAFVRLENPKSVIRCINFIKLGDSYLFWYTPICDSTVNCKASKKLAENIIAQSLVNGNDEVAKLIKSNVKFPQPLWEYFKKGKI